jgi:hypothetical protein
VSLGIICRLYLCAECSVNSCLCEASLIISSYGQEVVPQIHKRKSTIWIIRECASERSVYIECSASL